MTMRVSVDASDDEDAFTMDLVHHSGSKGCTCHGHRGDGCSRSSNAEGLLGSKLDIGLEVNLGPIRLDELLFLWAVDELPVNL